MKEKSETQAGISSIVLILIVFFVVLIGGLGIDAYRVNSIIKEAEGLTEQEKYDFANQKLELAQKSLITKIGFYKKGINKKIENNGKLSFEKSKYEEGLSRFEQRNWQETINLFSSIEEDSPYHQKVEQKLEEAVEKVSEKDSQTDKKEEPIILPPPEIDIKANNSDGPIVIPYNSSVNLTWTSINASSCSAHGPWSGSKKISGSHSTEKLISAKSYMIKCTGPGGLASDSVTVNIHGQLLAPEVDLKVNDSDNTITLPHNSSITLSWSSKNAGECTASGSWSGKKNLSGSEQISDLTSEKTYALTCKGQGGSAQDLVNVKVQQPTLSVSLSASPSSGEAPLNDVSLEAMVSGTAKGSINYKFDCTNNGEWDKEINNSSLSSFTANNLCNYLHDGTYTARVYVERGLADPAEGLVNIQVSSTSEPILPHPEVSIKANDSDGPISIDYNSSVIISWTSINASSCTASNGWSGEKPISGSEAMENLTSSQVYTITCKGPGGEGTDTIVVEIKESPIAILGFTANPYSGFSPLEGVDLTVILSGVNEDRLDDSVFYCDRTDNGINITPGWAKWYKKAFLLNNSVTALNACTYTLPGNYTAKVIVKHNSTSLTATTSIVVGSSPANNPPLANAGPDKEVFSGQSIILNGSGSDPDGDPITFSWNCNGGTISNSSIAKPLFTAPLVSEESSYTCTLMVNDSENLSCSDQMIITVKIPTLSVNLSANPSSGSSPLQGVDLTATTSGTAEGPISYQFSCQDNDIIDYTFNNIEDTTKTVTNACHYTSPGEYSAKVIVKRNSQTAEAATTICVQSSSVKAVVLVDYRLYELIKEDLDNYIELAETKRGFDISLLSMTGMDDWSYVEVKNFIKNAKSDFSNLEGALIVGNIKFPSFYKPRGDNLQVRLFSQYYADLDGVFSRMQTPGTIDPLCPTNDPYCNVFGERTVPQHDFDKMQKGPNPNPELWIALLPVGFSNSSQNTYANYANQLRPFFQKAIKFYQGQLAAQRKVYKVSNQLWNIGNMWSYYGPQNIDFYAVNQFYTKEEKPDGCCETGDYCWSEHGELCYSRAPLQNYNTFQDFWNYYQTRAWMGENWQIASIYKNHMASNNYQFVWVNTHASGNWSIINSSEAKNLSNGGLIMLASGCSVADFYQPGSPSYVSSGLSADKNLLVNYVYGNSNFIAAMGDPFNRGHEAYYEELIPFMNQGDYLGKAFLKRWNLQYQNSSSYLILRENSQEMLIGDPFLSF